MQRTGGEHDERVLRQAIALQRRHNLAHRAVHLSQRVAKHLMVARPRRDIFVLGFVSKRRVRVRKSYVEEERLARVGTAGCKPRKDLARTDGVAVVEREGIEGLLGDVL